MTTRPKRSAVAMVYLLIAAISPLAAADLTLDQVLERLDRRSHDLESLQAAIEVRNWTELLEDFDQGETGSLYLLRRKGRTLLRRQIDKPQPSILLVADDKAIFYQPRIKQAVRYGLGERKDGASNLFFALMSDRETLERDFEIELKGRQAANGVDAYVLELVPRDPGMRKDFTRLVFWLHPEKWVPVRQSIYQVNDDYQRIDFAEIRLNESIPQSHFNLDLPKDVKIKTLSGGNGD